MIGDSFDFTFDIFNKEFVDGHNKASEEELK